MSTPITYRDLLIDRYKLLYDWVPGQTARILDLGCGNGVFTKWLQEKAPFVAGVDHNADQLRHAHLSFPGMITVAASADILPFANESFDVVIASDVVEHVDDDQAAIWEALRVLKPGGRLLVSVPNRGPLQFLDGDNLVNGMVSLISRLRIPKRGTSRCYFHDHVYDHHRHYSLRDLRKLMTGLAEVEKTYYGGVLLWPLAYLLEKLAEVFLHKPLVSTNYVTLRRMRAWDFRLGIGSWSYNLVACIKKG
jgi:SAM-dependent methyltransferase